MAEEIKLNKREAALLSRLQDGDTLCCEVDDTEEGRRNAGRRWFIEPSGKKVGPATAASLISKGVVHANSDGLFGEDAQTYRASA